MELLVLNGADPGVNNNVSGLTEMHRHRRWGLGGYSPQILNLASHVKQTWSLRLLTR